MDLEAELENKEEIHLDLLNHNKRLKNQVHLANLELEETTERLSLDLQQVTKENEHFK